MYLENILDGKPYIKFLEKDLNGRFINIYREKNIYSLNDLYYPNVFFLSEDQRLLNPYKEKIMSLEDLDEQGKNYKYPNIHETYKEPLFFFVYNTDNYYHFVYDTLPYLISYNHLKNTIPNIKILMSFPNPQKKELYKFVKEFLEILDITENDIEYIKKNTLYSEVYFSNSYTHDIDSNLPPRQEIYAFYRNIVKTVKESNNIGILPEKIYISRRTWLHGDLTNIGTNYTNRRTLESENELVNNLISLGFTEVFTENLSISEKILMFDNAKYVIGAIGGGLCNVLFSKSDCFLFCICSPTFLDVNARFVFSFGNVKSEYWKDTYHVDKNYWKKWMRIKSDNIVGEIEEINGSSLTIMYLDERVAGWNSEMQYKRMNIETKNCVALDMGLNSSWDLKVSDFVNYIKKNIKND